MSQANKQPVWTEQKAQQLFQTSSDVLTHTIHFKSEHDEADVMLLFAEGLCDSEQVNKVVLPELNRLFQANRFNSLRDGTGCELLPLKQITGEQAIVEAVFDGELLIFLLNTSRTYRLNMNAKPKRSPEESSIEISIKGAKDGFVEDYTTNIALIRKRIRSTSLCCESHVLGTRTRTKVALLYIRDILSPEILKLVRERLGKINIDGVYSINQLEEFLADFKFSLFPLLDTTGRPDFAVNSLLLGRFVIIVDGNPLVLIGPVSFGFVLKSPEDMHFSFVYVTFARLLRSISFWLAIMLPGFWVALSSFHQDQFPFRFAATISVSRLGLPLPSQLEMLVLLFLLEIFREAGVRLPSSIGQTLTVIGALVIGDAAIRAGLVGPSVVVIGAITAVMGVTLVNQTLSTQVSVIRLCVFFLSSVLGMYGVILSFISLIVYMSKLRSFGIPYLSPLSPFRAGEISLVFMKKPWMFMKYRPKSLHPIDPDQQSKEKNE